MSKKLQDDDKIATNNYVPPAIHFPNICQNKQKYLET